MRFSLQDVKKQVHRRAAELVVSLHFLHPGELRTEIESLVNYYERLLNEPQRRFTYDDARACIGDYRLAHCLVATLSHWYSWQQRDWSTVLQRMGDEARERLTADGISSPMHLRLALFNHVNERYAGFLNAEIRMEVLRIFAEAYALNVPDLEHLLALDSDEEALLVRNLAHAPSADEVATLYNQWAFEAALFNASDVHFVIDCNAFGYAQNVDVESLHNVPQLIAPSYDGSPYYGHGKELIHAPALPDQPSTTDAPRVLTTGVGAIIKRLCYLARKLGAYYDLAYDPAAPASRPLLHLTLYGPQEMTGAPQQYGLRLAKLCRMLLSYSSPLRRAASSPGLLPQGVPTPAGAKPRQKGMLASALLEASATVHFLQRSYLFVFDAELLNLLPSSTESNANAMTPADTSSLFDSSIEQSFAEAFSALENSQGVDGWRLEREPEPLLLTHTPGDTVLQGIFIPDFALTRAHRRIYVEILGFWTPAYRERKLQKLQQLLTRNDLLLAIPEDARTAFASIATAFPIVWYEGQLSASELLSVLRYHFDDFAERLARIDVELVRERVSTEGLLPEYACYELVHCYRRSELRRAAEYIAGNGIAFASGIGLYESNWMDRLRNSFVEWIGERCVLSLADVLREARVRWPVLKSCEDATIEGLIALWPEVRVRSSSIFEAVVEMADTEEMYAGEGDVEKDRAKKVLRERRVMPKKRMGNEPIQENLWG